MMRTIMVRDETWCGEIWKRKEKKELSLESWGRLESHVPLSCENFGTWKGPAATEEFPVYNVWKVERYWIASSRKQCLRMQGSAFFFVVKIEEAEIREV
jgi:hypothetical protein